MTLLVPYQQDVVLFWLSLQFWSIGFTSFGAYREASLVFILVLHFIGLVSTGEIPVVAAPFPLLMQW